MDIVADFIKKNEKFMFGVIVGVLASLVSLPVALLVSVVAGAFILYDKVDFFK